MIYYAYILKSSKDNRYYYGSCEDLNKRLAKHNSGKVKATKNRKPLICHYTEQFSSRSEAYRREHFFKSIDGYKWLKEQNII